MFNRINVLKEVIEVMPIIELKDVSFKPTYEEDALKDINLEIEDGTITVVLGDHLSGNRLLLQTFNCLIPEEIPDMVSGKIIVDGVDVTKSTVLEMATHVGVTLMDPALRCIRIESFDH